MRKTFGVALVICAFISTIKPNISYADDFDSDWASSLLFRGRLTNVRPSDDASYTPDTQSTITNEVIPEVDITYFLTDNVAFETICCQTTHTASVKNGPKVGEISLVPLMLVAQYHFHLGNGLKPYVGAGPNITVISKDRASSPFTSLDIDSPAIGFVTQAGIDYKLMDKWVLNVDVKKLYLDLDVNVNQGGVVGRAEIDPYIVSVGIGYRF